MLTGIAMPAHAWFGHARAAMPGEEFCTSVKPAEAAADLAANAAAYAPAAPPAGATPADLVLAWSGAERPLAVLDVPRVLSIAR